MTVSNTIRIEPAPLILFFNPGWVALPEAGAICGGACELSFDPQRLPEADAVVFHIPSLPLPIRLPKRAGQRWVAMSMESEVNYPQLADPAFMRWFDDTMTYRLDSDFPIPYADEQLLTSLRTPPVAKTEPAPAVYIASNWSDRSGRTDYVRALMEYIGVDAYGKCLQNRVLLEDRGRDTKLATIARYKFTLAFENSICRDYVTEKFFDPLIAGSVPVYLGAPNVADFAPGERCFINSADFSGPRALADFLLALAADEAAYQDYLAWKRQPLRPELRRIIELQRTHPLCRLCQALRRA